MRDTHTIRTRCIFGYVCSFVTMPIMLQLCIIQHAARVVNHVHIDRSLACERRGLPMGPRQLSRTLVFCPNLYSRPPRSTPGQTAGISRANDKDGSVPIIGCVSRKYAVARCRIGFQHPRSYTLLSVTQYRTVVSARALVRYVARQKEGDPGGEEKARLWAYRAFILSPTPPGSLQSSRLSGDAIRPSA